ncbi:MAG: AAA family ATPase, partial [Bradymonadaceae bacterium]|nr:AAA family ATPase [Lujinxingiaceae bacterium]
MTAAIEAHARALQEGVAEARAGLVERETLVELVALSAVAGEHMLVIGPPGTAKSEAIRRVAQALGGSYFEYLLGRFTEPSEIFGPVDLQRLRQGFVETATAGMLPEADIAFLDEVFLGSTAILNTLLSLLNERTFRRGHTAIKVPLRVCVGASNALPSDELLAAFADRFLVRHFVEPIAHSRLEDLLEAGWDLQDRGVVARASLADVDALARAARTVEMQAVRPLLAQAVRSLRAADIELSDRRIVKVQRLVAAAATLDGRQIASGADLWPIVFAVPTAEHQAQAREVLRELLDESRNRALTQAALEASRGPAARAMRIVERAREILVARPLEG